MKAPRQPGVEPRKEARVYCRHRPPCMMSVIRLLLAVSIKSTKSIITKTKTVIIRACLKISRISISFSPYRLVAGNADNHNTYPRVMVAPHLGHFRSKQGLPVWWGARSPQLGQTQSPPGPAAKPPRRPRPPPPRPIPLPVPGP